jgi:hypothetical protein
MHAARIRHPAQPNRDGFCIDGRRVRAGWLSATSATSPASTRKGTRMVNTYRTADEADRDKAHLVELFEALNASPSVLRRDDASPKPRASV